jgi:hypothetical protein
MCLSVLSTLHLNDALIILIVGPSIFVVKGKAIPLQALTGPEGSRRLRIPDLKTIGT